MLFASTALLSASAFVLPSQRSVAALANARFVAEHGVHVDDQPSQYYWQTRWFTQYVDQFNFMGQTSAATFQARYLINDTYFNYTTGGPILFYCGNEGFIELFANASGLVWYLAPRLGAMVIFAEHRYYGLSMPFGNASYDSIDALAYLSIEQALADYAHLIRSLKANITTPNTPVIAVGGSYGGMLAAWLRMKYPSAVVGALACSAPILQIPGIMDPHAYNHIITQTFATGGAQAPLAIYNAFQFMINSTATQPQRDALAQALRLCGTLYDSNDVWNAIFYLSGAIGYMAMADYPYPANFLGPMPAYPAAAAGAFFPDANAPALALYQGMADGIANIFYNYTGQAGTCFNISSSSPPGLQGNGWDVQCCREVAQPIGSYGWPSDLFWDAPFDLAGFINGCQQQFNGTTTRPYLQLDQYGGLNLDGVSNIVFTNGNLDPWYSGGIVSNATLAGTVDVAAYVIEGGAHHLDLRWPNAADPASCVAARAAQEAAVLRWTAQYAARLAL